MSKKILYTKYTGSSKTVTKYNSEEEIVVRSFLKGLLSTPPSFNLNREELNSYSLIVDYIKDYNPSIKISTVSLAKIKERVNTRKLKWLPVQKSRKSEEFVKYVQQKFSNFDLNEFYSNNEK